MALPLREELFFLGFPKEYTFFNVITVYCSDVEITDVSFKIQYFAERWTISIIRSTLVSPLFGHMFSNLIKQPSTWQSVCVLDGDEGDEEGEGEDDQQVEPPDQRVTQHPDHCLGKIRLKMELFI